MIGKPFINEVLSHAIEDYLKYKDKPEEPVFSSFLVMVIRTLIYIYGELDIINPYITQNEHNMGGFNSNLTKYGFSLTKVNDFKNLFLSFQSEKNEGKKPNVSFIKIQKYLIDMYFCKEKTMNTPIENRAIFQNYLYLSTTSNPVMQQELNLFVLNKLELDQYFRSVAFESSHQFVLEEVRRKLLTPEAYILLGYNLDQVNQLSDVDLRSVNNQVYQFFRVNPDVKDHEELLQKAVNYYKKYGNRVTTGNGYVDFLLFASILVTAVFVTSLFFVL